MSFRNLLAHALGVLLMAAGFGWLALDVRPDGHVELTTAVCVSILTVAGGFLIDKDRTAAVLAFLLERAKGAAGVVRELFTAKSGGA